MTSGAPAVASLQSGDVFGQLVNALGEIGNVVAAASSHKSHISVVIGISYQNETIHRSNVGTAKVEDGVALPPDW